MRSSVTLVAASTDLDSAVGGRIDAFAGGLSRRGWDVTVIDPPLPPTDMVDRLLAHAPEVLRSVPRDAGVEGDLRPGAGWGARHGLRGAVADVAVVSVPPFSLLWAAAVMLDPRLPLVVDYRDPWSARSRPPLLARATRTIERHALRRAAAVTYAGGPALGDLLVRRLQLTSSLVISVPNGFDAADVEGLPEVPLRPERNGQPLDLVMNGYWYGRNGPGILLDALQRVGPAVAELTVVGGVSPPIATRLHRATGQALVPHIAGSRRKLYERLHQADAALVTTDNASAAESRIPAKIYDYLATGVPVIAVCPPSAALLRIPGAQRFHHAHHEDASGLTALLRSTVRDRTALCPGVLRAGPTREQGVTTLHTLLRSLVQQP
ncbi:MAG: glycosyltransferase [Pseudonocardiales bacterium]|nr:glycosyltransferase [Pseudonocardiales bacterium]MBV9030417.1 glycosyltransferase [Pseudonocardiales bacterium]MBW0009156.1 glycosyltransferase [Pseudonocardiales bacterium]